MGKEGQKDGRKDGMPNFMSLCFYLIRRGTKRLDPLRAKKIFIRKAEDRPYLGFSYKRLINDPIRSGKRSQRKVL